MVKHINRTKFMGISIHRHLWFKGKCTVKGCNAVKPSYDPLKAPMNINPNYIYSVMLITAAAFSSANINKMFSDAKWTVIIAGAIIGIAAIFIGTYMMFKDERLRKWLTKIQAI